MLLLDGAGGIFFIFSPRHGGETRVSCAQSSVLGSRREPAQGTASCVHEGARASGSAPALPEAWKEMIRAPQSPVGERRLLNVQCFHVYVLSFKYASNLGIISVFQKSARSTVFFAMSPDVPILCNQAIFTNTQTVTPETAGNQIASFTYLLLVPLF